MSIAVNRVTKAYAQHKVVDDLSLEIGDGELFVLLGASGSGKSTLLRMIAGLMSVDAGTIRLHGKDVTDLPPQQRKTGVVFQNYSLFRHMTVAQNIAFSLSIRKVGRAEQKQRVSELLELIDLSGYEGRMPWQLSGGQQQRVALARALAHDPEVLLLDEPFGALDAKIRVQLRQNLRAIQRKLKVTTILVTHDQEEAFELADHIGIIEHGKLLDVGAPDELYRHPRRRTTATFLGEANLLPGRYFHRQGQRSEVELTFKRIPVLFEPDLRTGQPVEVLFRPEELDLAQTPAQLQSDPLGLGTITEVTFAGAFERVSIQLKTPGGTGSNVPLVALMDATLASGRGILPGAQLWVGYKDYHLLSAAEPA
jgi:ABC-type Fe3+/spermidine/putrescine transport system ATPase subunit